MYSFYKKNNTNVIVKAQQIKSNNNIDEEIKGLNPEINDWIIIEGGDKYILSDSSFRQMFTKQNSQLLFD